MIEVKYKPQALSKEVIKVLFDDNEPLYINVEEHTTFYIAECDYCGDNYMIVKGDRMEKYIAEYVNHLTRCNVKKSLDKITEGVANACSTDAYFIIRALKELTRAVYILAAKCGNKYE